MPEEKKTAVKKNIKTVKKTKVTPVVVIPEMNIDSREKFFSVIAEQIEKEKNKKTASSAPNSKTKTDGGDYYIPKEEQKSIRLYHSLAFKFIIFAAILCAIVFYFSIVKLTIVINPTEEMITENLIFDVYDKNQPVKKDTRSLIGLVQSVPVEEERTFQASGEEIVGEEIVGEVKLINNYSRNQQLVATTRILSPDNKLFRISNTVNIPAKGELKVAIYADEPSLSLAINPTQFTIPGLWAGLQDKIYAESDTAFVYQNKIKRYVRQADLDKAIADLNESLLSKVKSQFGEKYEGYDLVIYNIDNNALELELGAKLNEEVADFTAKANNRVVFAAFSKEDAVKMTKEKLELIIPDDKELISFDEEGIIYELESYDLENGLATIKTSFSGKMALKQDSELIDRNKIINLNKAQLEEYLDTFKEIASYELKFSPGFIKHAPHLADRIKIRIVD